MKSPTNEDKKQILLENIELNCNKLNTSLQDLTNHPPENLFMTFWSLDREAKNLCLKCPVDLEKLSEFSRNLSSGYDSKNLSLTFKQKIKNCQDFKKIGHNDKLEIIKQAYTRDRFLLKEYPDLQEKFTLTDLPNIKKVIRAVHNKFLSINNETTSMISPTGIEFYLPTSPLSTTDLEILQKLEICLPMITPNLSVTPKK